jgi:hypothetical protein
VIPANPKDPVSTKDAAKQLDTDNVKADSHFSDRWPAEPSETWMAGRADDDWLLTDMATTNEAPESRSQFDLICDNVQLDVAGRRSLLGDLGRILQNVFGLAAAVTDYRTSIEDKVSR